MNLAVCDDIYGDREHIKELLQRFIQLHSVEAEIYTFASGEEFLNASDIRFDAVFMDIFMDGINGIDAAQMYNDRRCRFIFTTTSPDFALNAFSVNAAHYLIKPVTYDGVADAMQRCFPDISYPPPPHKNRIYKAETDHSTDIPKRDNLCRGVRK